LLDKSEIKRFYSINEIRNMQKNSRYGADEEEDD